MRKLILQPASTGNALEHYRDTIEKTKQLSEIRPHVGDGTFERLETLYPDGGATVWGAVEGNRSLFNKLEPGDLVWFYRAGTFISQAEVTLSLPDVDNLANVLWDPDPQKGSFRHVFFLTKPEPIHIPWDLVRHHLGYDVKYVPQRLHVLEPAVSRELIDMFGEEGGFDDELAADAVTALEEAQEGKRSSGQGFSSNKAVRDEIEQYAMRLARVYFERMGYDVEDTSSNRPYDLVCTKGDRAIHVEVKGTQSSGAKVFLTRREVEVSQSNEKESALFIQHSVEIENREGEPVASGGKTKAIWPWMADDDHLVIVTYQYSVPAG